MIDLVASEQQVAFGRAKLDTLPQYCLDCEVRFACHGGCPRNRFIRTPDGEDGLNYLCSGYKEFFNHVDRPMRKMSELLHQERSPAEANDLLTAEDQQRFTGVGRNDPCPCGSGDKYKKCHGAATAPE